MAWKRSSTKRPFLLGDRPTIVDFGFVGPMFRHFAQDPTPQELMREHAPRLYEWVARMWLAEPSPGGAAMIAEIDEPLAGILREACETHLVQLRENAIAHGAGASHFAQEVQGCRYRAPARFALSRVVPGGAPTPLAGARRDDAGPSFAHHLTGPAPRCSGTNEPEARSDYDPERKAPFNRAINVFDGAVPK